MAPARGAVRAGGLPTALLTALLLTHLFLHLTHLLTLLLSAFFQGGTLLFGERVLDAGLQENAFGGHIAGQLAQLFRVIAD